MVLPYQTIKELSFPNRTFWSRLKNFVKGTDPLPLIREWNEEQAAPHSYDLTIKPYVVMVDRDKQNTPISNKERDKVAYRTVTFGKEGYLCMPNTCYLFTTNEWVNMPTNLCAEVITRSGAARLGINHATAGYIDAGFCGLITLEIYFADPTIVYPNDSFVQLQFQKLASATQKPYVGKYKNQNKIQTAL